MNSLFIYEKKITAYIQYGTTAILSLVWDISNFSFAQA